jgi:formimidoylglutamate deiminase
MPLLLPDLIYVAGRFEAGLALEYDADTGRITRIARADEFLTRGGATGDVSGGAGAPGGGVGGGQASGVSGAVSAAQVIERLPGRALLPGFINAHSHAFQRLIRGRTQWRPTTAPRADFWSWRDAMYTAALALHPEDVFLVSRFCFLEMLRAGITAVGEFHYLHRDVEGRRYLEPNELAYRVLDAAAEVGLRIALLNVCYATGGIGEPLRPEQRRFATPSRGE